MEKKSRGKYQTEYSRKRRGSTRRQGYGDVLEDSVSMILNIKKQLRDELKEVANKKGIGLNQLLREIIADYLNKVE